MSIKAIFFDIDGTLQTTNTNPIMIPNSTRLALKKLKQQGIKLIIATGRPYNITKEFRDLVDFEFDGWVTSNGQYCFIGDKVVREVYLDSKEVQSVFPYLNSQNIVGVIQHQSQAYQNIADDIFQFPIKPIVDENGNTHLFDENPVLQMMLKIDEKDKEIEKECFKYLKSAKATRWTYWYCDVIPLDGGKNKGIDAMLDYLNISLEDTMAFGDGDNDIDMIGHVGLGVAMGNGRDGVKAVAKYITDDILEDGLYNALVHFGVIEDDR